MRNPPCKNCTERHYKCHGECEAYQAFAEEQKKASEQLRMENYSKPEVFKYYTKTYKCMRGKYKRNYKSI